MKKILFIGMMSKSEAGGCEALWVQAASHLIRRGVSVTASIRDDDKVMASHLTALRRLGVQLHIRDKIQNKYILRAVASVLTKILNEVRDPWVWIIKNKPDLAVISQPGHTDGVEVMEACSRFAIPYVTITHLVSPAIWPADTFLNRLGAALEKSVRCFFISNANVELIQTQLGGANLKNYEVVRNPFNVSYDAVPKWPCEDVYRLLCLGRLQPFAKGQDILFQVMNMKKWRDRPIHVVCVGDGINAGTVNRLAQFFKLDNVEIRSFNYDVERLWADFHGLVLPSRHEGLPLVVVEAMLCGRFCVVTDVGGNKEFLEDGVTGFIAKAPTVELLDEAMERAWQKRHDWREMGQKAAAAVRKVVPIDPAKVFCDKLVDLMLNAKKLI